MFDLAACSDVRRSVEQAIAFYRRHSGIGISHGRLPRRAFAIIAGNAGSIELCGVLWMPGDFFGIFPFLGG